MNELMRTASDLVVALATTMLVVHSAALLKATKRLVFASETIANAEAVETQILENAVDAGFRLLRGEAEAELVLSSAVAVSILEVVARDAAGNEVQIEGSPIDPKALLEPKGIPLTFTTTHLAWSMEIHWISAFGGKRRNTVANVVE